MHAGLSLVGRAEEITGRWLKGKRNRFIVAPEGASLFREIERELLPLAKEENWPSPHTVRWLVDC